MTNIFLIRHAESEANVSVYSYLEKTDANIDLTKKGVSQSLRAGKHLQKLLRQEMLEYASFITYYSPFLRAKRTHDLILKRLNMSIADSVSEDSLVEQDFGFDSVEDKQGIDVVVSNTMDSLKDNLYFYAKSPNGESPADVVERIKPFVYRKILRAPDEANIIVVAHGTSIRAISHYLMEAKPQDFESTPANTAIKKLVLKNGKCSDEGWIYTP
jgi:broad specificity phosphatase PhoE